MKPRHSEFQAAWLAVLAGLLVTLAAGCARHPPGTFATPEEAVAALASLVGTGDEKRADEIFGAGSLDLFRTGDPAEDQALAAQVKQLIAEKVGFEEVDGESDTRVALFGEKAWPFPIPLVQKDGRWRFDTAAGREELLNRRIGKYELWTLAALHAYVDAQREYANAGHDGRPPAFAQRFVSTEDQQDGLYWPVAEGEARSPLGDLFAGAAVRAATQPARPFHGYYYRILTGQGKNAPGGEKSYLDPKGLMTGGFAAIAWPAKYGNSGVMTFVVNQQGIVFQKDLGKETDAAVAAIQSFDPDATWSPTPDTIEAVDGAGEEIGEPATGT